MTHVSIVRTYSVNEKEKNKSKIPPNYLKQRKDCLDHVNTNKMSTYWSE